MIFYVRTVKILALLGMICALPACGGSGNGGTTSTGTTAPTQVLSNFAEDVAVSGYVKIPEGQLEYDAQTALLKSDPKLTAFDLDDAVIRSVLVNCDCGYAYGVGRDASDRFYAGAGLVNPSKITGALPATGEVKYVGQANIHAYDRSSATDMTATPVDASNSVVLKVNVADGTFRGRTPVEGPDKFQLTVRGAIEGNDLVGTARLKRTGFNVLGNFRGKGDQNLIIGAFQGDNTEDTFAGGLIVTPQTQNP